MTTRAHLAVLVALAALVIAPAAGAEPRAPTLLSDGPFGVGANVDAMFIGASDDGSRVFLQTTEILAATDTDTAQDVYARTGSGAFIHISDDPAGPDDDYPAFVAGWSSDGTRAFFHTDESLAASDLQARAAGSARELHR